MQNRFKHFPFIKLEEFYKIIIIDQFTTFIVFINRVCNISSINNQGGTCHRKNVLDKVTESHVAVILGPFLNMDISNMNKDERFFHNKEMISFMIIITSIWIK